jgi:hypothetical protein
VDRINFNFPVFSLFLFSLQIENNRIKQKMKGLQDLVKQLKGTPKEDGSNFPLEATLDYDEIGRDFILVGGLLYRHRINERRPLVRVSPRSLRFCIDVGANVVIMGGGTSPQTWKNRKIFPLIPYVLVQKFSIKN